VRTTYPNGRTIALLVTKVRRAPYRAWPLAWPSPSGPLGWQRSPALKGGS
jgi:hypothetical protein